MLVCNKRNHLDKSPTVVPLWLCIKAFQEAGTFLGHLGFNTSLTDSPKLCTPKPKSRSCCKAKIILRDLHESKKLRKSIEIILTDDPKGERNSNTNKCQVKIYVPVLWL